MKRKYYSEEFKLKVVKEYLNNTSVLDLSNKYNVTTISIYRWLKKNNIKCTYKRKRKEYSLNYKKMAINYYVYKKLSPYKIGQLLKVNFCTIVQWLTQAKVYIKPKKMYHYSLEFKKQVIKDYINNPIPIIQLAKKYNINYATVARWLSYNPQARILNHNSKEFKLKVINEYINNNISINQLIKKYNIAVRSFKKWIQQFNYSLKINTPRNYSKEFKLKVVNEYINNDISINRLAMKYNLRHSLIASWLKQNNIAVKNPHKTIVKDEEVIEAYRIGLTILQINKKFHISNQRIKEIIKNI